MTEDEATKKLLKMKKIIEKNKVSKNRLEGQVDQIKKKLKTRFNCHDNKQIEEKLKSIGNKIESKEDELADELDALEKDFNWE